MRSKAGHMVHSANINFLSLQYWFSYNFHVMNQLLHPYLVLYDHERATHSKVYYPIIALTMNNPEK